VSGTLCAIPPKLQVTIVRIERAPIGARTSLGRGFLASFSNEKIAVVLSSLAGFLLFAAEASASGHENGLQALQKGDAETALQELKPAAEAGNDQAQFFLGLMFYDGIGVQQDYQAAARLMLLSAEQGFATRSTCLVCFIATETVCRKMKERRRRGNAAPRSRVLPQLSMSSG